MLRILACAIITSASDRATMCNKQQKQGPYSFKEYVATSLNLSRLELEVTRTQIRDTGKNFYIGYRSVWRSYCYNGGSVDPNTGCINSLEPRPPTETELEKWGSESACYTGPDAANAWGSDSRICLENWRMNNKYTAKELTKRSNNNNFPYHTCNLSWRCGVKHTHIDVRLITQGRGIIAVIITPEGSTKQVSEVGNTYWVEGEFSYLYKPSVFGTQNTKVYIKCFKEHVKTEVPTGGYTTVIHDLTTEKYHCRDGDNFFEMPASGTICLPNACYKKETGVASQLHPGMWNISQQLHSASVYDTNNVIHSLVYETESLRLSLAQIDHRFNTLSKMFNKLVSSVAKIDERLIGNLIDRDAASTFASNEKFFLSPCVTHKTSESNCVNNSIYSDGRWVHNDDPTKCFSLTKSKEVDLFGFQELWIPEIVSPKVTGIIADEEGWAFVANSKKALQDTMLYTKNGGKGTSLEDIINYPSGWLDGKLQGLLFNGAANWVVLGVCILALFYILRRIL
ncbi:glycoprotein [Thailand tick thogotovirus]|uniref:Glycoprotein n=1 Tax=Thailand tick thogotovirus TaxID=2654565 RepID=A0A5P8N5U7_9ORTO|nr:glycoprotein [Thailand tick thogotovirus]QFR36191.1 glycoprotein [Thailand tick thogotovirus]